jgi:hypothetical protein
MAEGRIIDKRWLTRDVLHTLFMADSSLTLGAAIVSDPVLRHGEPILAGTATPVRAIAELWNQGMAPEEVPCICPTSASNRSSPPCTIILAIGKKSTA